jgi:hypothetical protein
MHKAKKKPKKRLEFSKIILIGISVIVLAVTAFSLALSWVTRDSTPLLYLIPAVFGELATATGFYYTKARAENTRGGIVYDAALAGQNQAEDGG